MPMPSVTDLQMMYGSWNPQAYLTAQDNAGLERQFRDQEYIQEQEKAKRAELDTMFQRQNDPLKLENQRQVNTNLGYTGVGLKQTNESAGLKLEREKALQQFNLNADQRKALMQVTDDELKQADQVIEQLRRSLNPEDQKRGQQLYEFTGAARALKQAQAEKMEMERYKQMQETGRAVERNQTTIKAAEIAQAGQDRRFQPRTPAGVDFWTSYYKLRTAPDKHAALILEARKIEDTNPEGAAQMRAMAEDVRAQAQAQIASPKPGGIDTGAVANLPVNPAPAIAPPPRGNLSNVPRGKGTKEDPIVLK